MSGGGFLSLVGAASASDLGIGMNAAAPGNLSEEDLRKKKKQLEATSQANRGVGQAPGANAGASLSLLGR